MALFMASAIAIPRMNSMATERMAMMKVFSTAFHHSGELSTVP